MLASFTACRCAVREVRSKSDGYTCRTARRRLADGGSNPPSSTTIQKTNRSRLVFFRPFPPVLAWVWALLRRTPPPRTALFRAVFRSQFPPILCFCEGRRRARTSNDAGFRLLVRLRIRLRAGDPASANLRMQEAAVHLSARGLEGRVVGDAPLGPFRSQKERLEVFRRNACQREFRFWQETEPPVVTRVAK